MKWYVLRSISGKENKVKEYIEGALVTSTLFKEYVSQVLIPTEKVVSLRGGKRVIKERNLLPGYVLVECNPTDECYPLLRNIPNVLGFLSDGKASTKPAPVPQSEINKIMVLPTRPQGRAFSTKRIWLANTSRSPTDRSTASKVLSTRSLQTNANSRSSLLSSIGRLPSS